jgi:carboxymethylenebutenolidase
MKDRISINGHEGTFGAYIARPEVLPAPAVVVLQELFGVNADIREKCDEFLSRVSSRWRLIYSGVKRRA